MRRFGSSLAGAIIVLSCGDDGSGRTNVDGAVVGSGARAAELCWSTINAHRTKAALPALERWTENEPCAESEAKSDADTNRPHGAFPRCGELAQNECAGMALRPEEGIPVCLDAMWREGPGAGHYDAMANRKYTKVACGIFVTKAGLMWSVQDFR